MVPLHELESVPVGRGLCLFGPLTGTLGLLNAAARETWERGGHAADGLTEEISAALHGPLPEPADAASLPADEKVLCPLPASVGFYGLQSGPVVGLRCALPELAELLKAVLAPFAIQGEPASVIDANAGPQAGQVKISVRRRDRRGQCRTVPRDEARRYVLQQLLLELHGDAGVAAVLHASAVSIGERALLIAGRSGAGKSTLTVALVAAGASYLSDDLLPLAADGRHVLPFPLALSVKSGSWELVGALLPKLWQAREHRVRDLRVRYLPMTAPETIRRAVPVGAIVVPSYEPGAATELVPLSPEETFALLIDSGSEIVGAPPSVRPLARLVDTVPGFRLAFGDVGDAARQSLSLLGAV